ncbi:CAP Gly-rich domain [Pseudocohnilembus persalinus]|uniref:CAP Gly-rich domain n=1 Tax=Pseudocohnilembus persalinus TaxID=266149 RepID=A0A0V0QRA0_PSEPJ|nr:CAP Gly-rich domain [Pseudocohnilembus persalinus]|eukprot:KRX04779.1 CAP Gly-rich domain [Pseudocohnilembus persalinus]
MESALKNTTVKLNLSHNISEMKMPEIRFDLESTIATVKQSIERRYGTNAEKMELVLQDSEGNNITTMGDNEAKLGFYSPKDGYWVNVLDLDPDSTLKNLDDVSLVQKYEISEEDYDKLQNNFRKWKQKLISNNPSLAGSQPKPPVLDPEYGKDLAEQIKLGDRCKVKETGHRGEVKYIGKVPNLAQGYFIGVSLDEPYGKNDGSHIGVQYFQCLNKCGLFLRPEKIEVGDFPELDIDDELDEI